MNCSTLSLIDSTLLSVVYANDLIVIILGWLTKRDLSGFLTSLIIL